ncbi:uncharacterized protein LACBIDRAFT_303163 [Laccaria bicolor S238N-H82]|uniref:Predicted protein n=1 Tax=Laccaria bicolor (strain S238N-H82 / ATCC MYA-4686) TaxID=486041 RepID=B0DJ21_LACBS|nr:uncharacterized protein LACBIDRAFT_303163 [Laccaria bicolor S238N-H82]EDR05445.1 predicted protein [Laccaria bicolor S238N-H82]|eukprot:XP_001884003.1 predicted protein [Laccaria bicolor S238N-H82]
MRCRCVFTKLLQKIFPRTRRTSFVRRVPPGGGKIFILGEHACGVAASVSATTETSLSAMLAFFPAEKAENDQFKAVVQNRRSTHYFPFFKAAEMVGMSGRALGKITLSFMIIASDEQRTKVGLSFKFEAKALNYSRKEGRHWEYSQRAIDLIR